MSNSLIPKRWFVFSFLFIGVLAASSGAIFIRLAQENNVPSLIIAVYRLLIASLLLAPISYYKYRSQKYIFKKTTWLLFLLAGFFLAFHFAFWITSLEYTSISSSVIFVSTTPIWVVIAGSFLLHESNKSIFYLGMLVAIIGSTIIGLNDICLIQSTKISCSKLNLADNKSLLGNVLAILGACSAAGYLILGRKLRSTVPLLIYLSIVYSFSAVLLTCLAIISHKSFFGYPSISYLWLVLLALIPQLIGHSFVNWSLKYLPSSVVSTSLLGEPVGSTIFAILLFHEEVSFIKILGIAVLLIGIWLSTRKYPS